MAQPKKLCRVPGESRSTGEEGHTGWGCHRHESEGQEREQNGLASEIRLGSSGLLSRVHCTNTDWICLRELSVWVLGLKVLTCLSGM